MHIQNDEGIIRRIERRNALMKNVSSRRPSYSIQFINIGLNIESRREERQTPRAKRYE